ncbi:MAG: hypothetical protein EA363_10875 [Balneolaceae bacterium]|nr:MAG: hypothetical protein EA363_10875 [Balneolaceae bacterium]
MVKIIPIRTLERQIYRSNRPESKKNETCGILPANCCIISYSAPIRTPEKNYIQSQTFLHQLGFLATLQDK